MYGGFMAFISVENIVKQFDDKRAVDDVSFRVESGRIFGFLGPNGAGKTTTIRMIMNITIPDSGSITFNGSPMSEELKAHIGYLPEERGLYPKMKVQPLLEFIGQLKGLSLKNARLAIDKWFGRFDIDSWREKKVEELSKGMQQKIQFIATIMHNPDMVILDEPFSGLDPVNVDVLRDIIVELKDEGKIVMFSTHMMEKAEQLCDEIFLINDGKGILTGSLTDIKKEYGGHGYVLDYQGELKPMSEIVSQEEGQAIVEVENPAAKKQLLTKLNDQVEIVSFKPNVKSLHQIFVEQVGGENV
jgi:ABC-2 type transport system ATP-binding protein